MERIIAVRNKKTIYRDGDRCVKVFSDDYSKADILNEALNQARIEETGLCIPKVLEVTTVDGAWAIISEFIKGKTLAQLMQEKSKEFEKYLTMFVELQLKVHSKECPALNRLEYKMIDKISRTELDVSIRCDLQNRLKNMPMHSELCHGDYNPSNVIIAENGTPYILDWPHAAQGDPNADAANTFLLFCLNGEREEADLYLKLFCQKSCSSVQQVQMWLPLIAASQLTRANAAERDCLLNWINCC